LQDPETYYKEKAEKERHNQEDKGFGRTSYQSQRQRRPRGDSQGQGLHGQANHSQQIHPQGQYSSFQTQADYSQAMPQMHQATSPMNQMFREYSDSFVIQQSMSSQFSSEFINPGQMSGMQNSGVFSQYPGQQSMQRQAFMLPVQDNIGESPQIQFFNYREGTPMMMQGSHQSQSARSDRQFLAPSDQGRLPIGVFGGNPTQSTDRDRFSCSEISSANTAIRQQSSRGADLLTQSLGNYLFKFPQDARFKFHQDVR
jgi:hypothetical protein